MSEVCPTPLVAFGIKQYECCGGVMVTASHNSKEDNGYKVFWKNGAQVSFNKINICIFIKFLAMNFGHIFKYLFRLFHQTIKIFKRVLLNI